MLSRTARYGLKAAVHIAEQRDSSPARVEDLSRALDVPRNYLSKILHRMARAGLLNSTRGRGGGFKLRRDPGTVTLREVIECLEPTDVFDVQCLLGRPACSDADPCTAHGRWCAVRDEISRFFAETTLADLARPEGGG